MNAVGTLALERENRTLRDVVKSVVHQYFEHLEGEPAVDLYNLVLSEIEAPLLEVVMKQAEWNQSRAADWLGLSRSTLRKKLAQHGVTEA